MSVQEGELLKRLIETFIEKAEEISKALTELKVAINHFSEQQKTTITKLDELRLEIRELATRIEMALRR